MQRAIELHPVENYEPLEVLVTEPGNLRRIVTGFAAPSTVIPTSMGRLEPQPAKPYPVLLFEIDPSLKARRRYFLWLPVGAKIDYDGELKYRDTYIDPATTAPFILYEVVNS